MDTKIIILKERISSLVFYYLCKMLIISKTHMEKKYYETPMTKALEIMADGLICTSTLMTIILLDSSPASEVDFGRQSYGSATTDAWE
ncbi:MAG: hypothetical protein J5669_08955 [Bacteroidales bacterium]|nr:hypothetical protein [Bacteroidales bacterium]